MTVLYFAVPDPDDPGQITYWRRLTGGQLTPWPPYARYGPTLRAEDIPADLDRDQRHQFLLNWVPDTVGAWHTRIATAINADPHTYAAQFEAMSSECFLCARELTDAAAVYGLCPGCRTGLPGHVLGAFATVVGRLHAEVLAARQPNGDAA